MSTFLFIWCRVEELKVYSRVLYNRTREFGLDMNLELLG